MTAQSGTGPALAICGSAIDGVAFRVAVRGPHGIAATQSPPGQRGDLARLVQQACAEAGVAIGELREVRVDRGPGSYIGLRVAITFARTLCAFGGPELFAADSLQLLALAALTANPALRARRLLAIVDGRQGRLHGAVLRCAADGTLQQQEPPAAWTRDELRTRLQAGDALLTPGAQVAALRALTADANVSIDVVEVAAIAAADLFAPALHCERADLLGLEPLYLMGSYVDQTP